MSNTAKILKGACTVWIILKDLMAVKLGTQTKDQQRNSLNSISDVTIRCLITDLCFYPQFTQFVAIVVLLILRAMCR